MKTEHAVSSKAVVLLLIFHYLWLLHLFFFWRGDCVWSLFCFAVLCVLFSLAVISIGKRDLVALLFLCFECHIAVIVL